MKRNSYIIVSVVVVIIIIGSLFIFGGSQAGKNSISTKDIYTMIEQGETQIDLTKLTDFEWTRVEVFGPYTTDEMIEDSMDINFLFGGIEVMEIEFLLVFANENKPVETVHLSREYGDYTIKENKFLIVE